MINKNTSLKIYTFLFLTCFTLFWGLYRWLGIDLFSYMAADFALCVIAAVFAAAMVLQNGGRFTLEKGSFLFLSLFLLTCAEIINTGVVAVSQPLYLTLSEAFPFASVCLEVFVLSRLIRRKEDLEWFMKAIEVASIVIACFSILQFFLYPRMIIFPTDPLPLRNGLHRIYVGGGSVLSIGALISMGNLLSNYDRKRLSLMNLILVFVTLAVVRQARSNTAYLLCVLLIGIMSVSNIPRGARLVMYLGIAGLAAIGFVYGDGGDMVADFTQNDEGVRARINGIRFFLEKFRGYPFLGMGFITTSGNLDPVSYSLLCSPSGYRYDRSDVGIIGVLNMFGLFGVFWYGAFLARIGSNGRKARRSCGLIHGKLIFWYLLITSLNLIVMTMQMSMMIPLTVALTDKLREFSAADGERICE